VAVEPYDFQTLELVDVSRRYGRRRALARTTLTFRAGEIAGLFGPNGAGKSTLLGLVSTLMQPSDGEVRYGGATAGSLGERLRARIGMLGHDLFLYGDLTARENLEFFGRLYGAPDWVDRATRALAAARLEVRANDRVSGFSRGLRQRLALERALLSDPRLVLLDEPFTGLDDESAEALKARLRVVREAGAIVLMATHDFEHGADVIDRAICLREGRVRELTGIESDLRGAYRRAMAEAWS
jgi:heme exporter protein A